MCRGFALAYMDVGKGREQERKLCQRNTHLLALDLTIDSIKCPPPWQALNLWTISRTTTATAANECVYLHLKVTGSGEINIEFVIDVIGNTAHYK